ncbi:MAG TPA: alpha/beta fold hydrolase [Terriglobales bacterium]
MRRSCLLVFWLVSMGLLYGQTSQKQLTIEAIFSPGSVTGRAPEGLHWAPDQKSFTYIQRDDSGEHGQLWLVNAATGEKRVLVGEDKLAKLSPPVESIRDDRQKDQITRYHVAPYYWAPDSKHLLFTPYGQLWLYNLDNGTAVQISPSPDPVRDPKFSSDGKRLAYVRAHDLYVQSLDDRFPKQLTKSTGADGKPDPNFLNGEVDWVYAEELAVRSNYFWSPDNKQIAFLQMDETQVPTYPITDWMPTHPSVDMEKYPKAGDPNPVVRLGLLSGRGGKVEWISLTDDKDIYIPRFGWLNRGTLWAEVLNRHQDQLDLYFIDAGSRKARKVLTESAPDSWINVNDDFTVMESQGQFLWTSWRDGHTHIYLYSYDKNSPLAADAKLARQLTSGDFEVLGIQSVDEKNGVVYFNCNKDDPRQQQIYSVKLDGSGLQRVSKEDGFHDPIFSDRGTAYLDNYSGLLTPNQFSVCDTAAANCHRFAELKSVAEYGLEPPKQLTFKAEDGTLLYGQLLLPPNPSAGAKVPVIVNIYGGPAAQVVLDQWPEWAGASGLFAQLLARQGFAVFSVDNRGTPGRGRKFQSAIRHEFGGVELRDQLTSLDQLFAQFPQLDRDRLGIWGWSNGGSMTLYALTHSDRFRAGVSVAPVTDWHNYDSIYTERYQGLPADDPNLYGNPITKFADKLHGALLLAHGTEDDNVHFQNSIQMIDALIRARKQFRFMAYPNKTHSIEGPNYRIHLFHMIEDHFERELKPEP